MLEIHLIRSLSNSYASVRFHAAHKHSFVFDLTAPSVLSFALSARDKVIR